MKKTIYRKLNSFKTAVDEAYEFINREGISEDDYKFSIELFGDDKLCLVGTSRGKGKSFAAPIPS